MCADLFHTGHVNYLRQCRAVADKVFLIVGIHSDATIQSYKRASVCTMEERVGVVEACKFVDQVLRDAPLRVTEEFMDEHAIDFVIHGTETPEAERQAMYDVPIGRGRYTEVPRTAGISTTELFDRIASRLAVDYTEHALPSERQPVRAVVKQIQASRSGLGQDQN
jgi:cytidyltransferase-like protein